MAKETSVVEIPAPLRPVLEAAAKNLLHHLYGPQGPAWGTSLASVEEMAILLSNYMGSQLIQQSLQLQASQPLPVALRLCPSCGRPTQQQPPEPHSLDTDLGPADWQEPASHCEHCRKAFFPSVEKPRH